MMCPRHYQMPGKLSLDLRAIERAARGLRAPERAAPRPARPWLTARARTPPHGHRSRSPDAAFQSRFSDYDPVKWARSLNRDWKRSGVRAERSNAATDRSTPNPTRHRR